MVNTEIGGCEARVVYYRMRRASVRQGFGFVPGEIEVFIGTGPGCSLAPGHDGGHAPDGPLHPQKIARWEFESEYE